VKKRLKPDKDPEDYSGPGSGTAKKFRIRPDPDPKHRKAEQVKVEKHAETCVYLHRLPRSRVFIVVDALLLREAEEVGQLFVQRLEQLLPHFRQRLQQLFTHLTTDGMKKKPVSQKCQKYKFNRHNPKQAKL
jgi:hypothetical protein